jgi:glycosyltransferase involved in cell wall biosynthesis
MRVALFHNRYIAPGGEDVVFAAEAELLRSAGHDVAEYVVSNERIAQMPRHRLAANTLWSADSRAAVKRFVREFEPELAHFHNTFPLLSPAVYSACHRHGIPVVQTLHNYRLICPGSIMFRDGRVCSDCVHRIVAWPGVLHGCYRESRPQTAVVAAMLALHRGLRTFHKQVDVFITLTEFARQQMVDGGLHPDRVVVKPNFVLSDPGVGDHREGFALYVGRLSEEKGIRVLCEAWRRLSPPPPLIIVGDGPLKEQVVSVARDLPSVRYLGRQDPPAVMELMQSARTLIVPSLWFEGFPMVIAEAYSTGLPVIASNLGSLTSLVRHRDSGLLFEPNDAGSLVDVVEWAWSNAPALDMMSAVARSEYEQKYSAEANLRMLIGIYERALERRVVRRDSSRSPV